MAVEPDPQSSFFEFALIAWAKDRRWLSATTVRRRLHVDKEEAEHIMQSLILAGALHPEPEGTVYRVRYPRRSKTANRIYVG